MNCDFHSVQRCLTWYVVYELWLPFSTKVFDVVCSLWIVTSVQYKGTVFDEVYSLWIVTSIQYKGVGLTTKIRQCWLQRGDSFIIALFSTFQNIIKGQQLRVFNRSLQLLTFTLDLTITHSRTVRPHNIEWTTLHFPISWWYGKGSILFTIGTECSSGR